ncbi:YicC/YloC family endoribonuclease [Candidatus Soleaferrea massiliensis]|uniref:YicC/YloC family endoribonuclease n=1 Tax=Candidatus Soleaferrea massiliensis TaxID=1470354 RepID=UPI00058D19A5|nr:YicC/YloC family endoribonuclease [Candidatus Soleaferrea massiliensis]
MIKSMTGYGREQVMIDGRDITVEIKSVNHRFFEFSGRVPRAYGYLEEKMKSYIQAKVSRGKVDAFVTVQTIEGIDANVEINRALTGSYIEALRSLTDEFGLEDDLSLSGVARLPDVFTVRKAPEDEEVIWNAVEQAAAAALEKFLSMREKEGRRLKADILSRLSAIEDAVGQVEQLSPQTVSDYQARLYNKMCEILEEKQIDEQRILLEAAIFADKVAVDEETVRLRSHIGQLRGILESDGPVGRKLDFLVQELNREANTIGSKAQNVGVANIVVNIKAEIEKIREQIQNIE